MSVAKKKKQEPPAPRFVLNLSESQAQVLVAALDFYSRIGIGSLHEVEGLISREAHCRKDACHDAVRNALDFVKRELYGLEANAGFGIFHKDVPDKFKVAWDLQQVIRHKIAWTANPAGGFGVNYHEPMKSGSEQLATMDVATELEKLLQALRESVNPDENQDAVTT